MAVATQPPSVGAIVPWSEWRVGAIATQASSNYTYGPRGLALLRQGLSARDVVRRLTTADPQRQRRQLAIVDRRGHAAAWTGANCLDHALHVTGDGYSCQGNILASTSVVSAMAKAFETARGTLGSRMLLALRAGAREGGDRRGLQSAALLVTHREPWFESAWPDHWTIFGSTATPARSRSSPVCCAWTRRKPAGSSPVGPPRRGAPGRGPIGPGSRRADRAPLVPVWQRREFRERYTARSRPGPAPHRIVTGVPEPNGFASGRFMSRGGSRPLPPARTNCSAQPAHLSAVPDDDPRQRDRHRAGGDEDPSRTEPGRTRQVNVRCRQVFDG